MNFLHIIFSNRELKNKILYVFTIIMIYRLGTHITIPGINFNELQNLFFDNSLLSFVNLFSGGALERFSIFALGILPYINASIIMQLLNIIWPSLKELSQEGESGRKIIAQYTRYLAVGLSFIQATVMSIGFKAFIFPDLNFYFFLFYSIVSLVAGAALVMWFGELISEYGIGNGASILIFISIIAQMPTYIQQTITLVQSGASLSGVFILIFTLIFIIVAIVYIQEAERKIPVQYAKRVVGRKMMGSQNTYIPLKLIQGGVMPIIFASAVMQFPLLLTQYFKVPVITNFFSQYYTYDGFLYNAIFCILIFFFAYFYTAITFNPEELAENIRKYGGFITGVRPGKSTVHYLEAIINTLTLIGASFLALIALIPIIAANSTNINSFIGLGGTALLIIVGVALDLVRQIETFAISKQYENLVK